MLILQLITLLIMFIGQICTLAPNVFGTLIIFGAASLYAFAIGFQGFSSWVFFSLLVITIVAEVVLRWLRIFLTKSYDVSRRYSVNATVGNLVGIIVADALLGSLVGVTIWELIIGRAFFPYFKRISKVLMRLFIIAALRFICGLLMITIIINYIMLN